MVVKELTTHIKPDATVAWLLEREREPSHAYDEIFLGIERGEVRWHVDAFKALRFSRKEDAESVWELLKWTGDALCQTVYRPVSAREHMFYE